MINNYYKSLTITENVHVDFQPDAWTVVGYYKGFIQPMSGGETFRDGKGGESATHRMYTVMGTPVKYRYRVTQGGQDYIMLYAIQPAGISGTGHHKEIIMGIFE